MHVEPGRDQRTRRPHASPAGGAKGCGGTVSHRPPKREAGALVLDRTHHPVVILNAWPSSSLNGRAKLHLSLKKTLIRQQAHLSCYCPAKCLPETFSSLVWTRPLRPRSSLTSAKALTEVLVFICLKPLPNVDGRHSVPFGQRRERTLRIKTYTTNPFNKTSISPLRIRPAGKPHKHGQYHRPRLSRRGKHSQSCRDIWQR